MHVNRVEIDRRLSRVVSERLLPAVYRSLVPLTVRRFDVPGEPISVTEALAAEYAPSKVGERWGPAWGTTWFELAADVPDEWAGEIVEGVVDLGFDRDVPGFAVEGLVYRPDGTAIKGLHPFNRWFPVDSQATSVRVLVEAAANPSIVFRLPTQAGDLETASIDTLYTLRQADLGVVDVTVRELVADLDVLSQLADQLPDDEPRAAQIRAGLSEALDAVSLSDISGTAARAREILAPLLTRPAHASAHQISAVGHAHIDSAWLWPLRETVRKVARTCANVTQLMDDHPDLVFVMSQAQHLAWLEDSHPDLFARVEKKIAAGQFVPVGGMWVEADTNMPGGEAMARQLIHGKRYYRERFGIDTQEVWLPDSFGYSAGLPQLIALSGSRWFMTQKLSWNRTNRFPHHTFWWEGIDGTRIFTHFPPVDTYNSDLSGAELAHASRRFADKAHANHSLAPFGWGDGGGGPTREMVGRAYRTRDLEGSPRVRMASPSVFFADAEAENARVPVWCGELYLEIHRGTYTSHAKLKQGNRRSEHLLREAELWATTAAIRTGAEYPYNQLDRLWKTVLLHQFHDILPGSSIAWVNREARESYRTVTAELEKLINETLKIITSTDSGERADLLCNAAPFLRSGVPALGCGAPTVELRPSSVQQAGNGYVLDNGRIRAEIDGQGLITSLVDATTGRDAIAPGGYGNLLQVHPDLPNDWDAWDLDGFYRNTRIDLTAVEEMKVVTMPGGVAGLELRRRHGLSTFTHLISLSPGSMALEIQLDADWRERETFLKASFDLDVRAEVSSSETQFGHVNRPTHDNTSWDAAKFEICAHRFIHLAEPGYGVAVVNDSTYGHDVTRAVRDDGGTTTTLRLSLLRAPRWPDPETDQGDHRLRYWLVPAAKIMDAVREGYAINLPARTVVGGKSVSPLIMVDSADVVVECVKLAEDRSGDVVVRIYAASGGRAASTVRADFQATSVESVDLLERPLDIGQSWPDPTATVVDFRPFQIVTLRYHR